MELFRTTLVIRAFTNMIESYQSFQRTAISSCQQILTKTLKHKTNSDDSLFYLWARQNLEMRKVQDIPRVELDSLQARMYLGM